MHPLLCSFRWWFEIIGNAERLMNVSRLALTATLIKKKKRRRNLETLVGPCLLCVDAHLDCRNIVKLSAVRVCVRACMRVCVRACLLRMTSLSAMPLVMVSLQC